MKLKLMSAAILALSSMAAQATEIIHYANKPITVELQTGVERTIQLGDHVAVGVTPQQEMMKLFRTQSAQGAVHILANQDFEAQRIQLRRMTDGQIILVDLVAAPPAQDAEPLEDIRVYVAGEDELPVSESDIEPINTPAAEPIDPVALTRYAAVRMYAPARLHKEDMRVTPINLSEMQGKQVRLFKGINAVLTEATPMVAYRGGTYELAAILVRNTSQQPAKLNYLDLAIPFGYATYQHHTLAPAGQPGDRTVAYIINDRPLKETLVPWTYFSDAAAARAAKPSKENN